MATGNTGVCGWTSVTSCGSGFLVVATIDASLLPVEAATGQQYVLTDGGHLPFASGFYVTRTGVADQYAVAITLTSLQWSSSAVIDYLATRRAVSLVLRFDTVNGLAVFVDSLQVAQSNASSTRSQYVALGYSAIDMLISQMGTSSSCAAARNATTTSLTDFSFNVGTNLTIPGIC